MHMPPRSCHLPPCALPSCPMHGCTYPVSYTHLLFLEQLQQRGIKYTLFDEVKPNPTIENVRAGLACYKNSGSDFILAVGGGSVIDTAKAVAVTANNPENEDIVSLEGMDKSKRCV